MLSLSFERFLFPPKRISMHLFRESCPSLFADLHAEVHTCASDYCKRYNCYCHYPKCHHNLFPFFNYPFINLLSFFHLFECKDNAFCVRTQTFQDFSFDKLEFLDKGQEMAERKLSFWLSPA